MLNADRKLLILDLDETLIFASESPLDRAADFMAGHYHVYRRPYIREFLELCFDNFAVAIWTTSSPAYAQEIAGHILSDSQVPEFIWARDRCTMSYDEELQTPLYVKKLTKLRGKGFQRDQIIVVDDSPNVWSTSYGNLVRVSRFEGEMEDSELPLLVKYLTTLLYEPDVRKIEKRNWRSKIKS